MLIAPPSMERNRQPSTVSRPGTVHLCNIKPAETGGNGVVESFAPDEKREMARAMGRALELRGGADSSVAVRSLPRSLLRSTAHIDFLRISAGSARDRPFSRRR